MIRCPHCRSKDVSEIIQKLPDSSSIRETANSTGSIPRWKCSSCGRQFGKSPVFSFRGKKYTPDEIQAIEYEIGGFFGGYDSVSIQRTDDQIILNVSTVYYDGINPMYSRIYSKREWDALMKTLFNRLFVHEWKKSYVNPCVLDGTQWGFTLVFPDGKRWEINGSNDYPPLWDSFYRRFRKYIHEMQVKQPDSDNHYPDDL